MRTFLKIKKIFVHLHTLMWLRLSKILKDRPLNLKESSKPSLTKPKDEVSLINQSQTQQS